MSLESLLAEKVKSAVQTLYAAGIEDKDVVLNETKKEFEGDITLVVFPLTKIAKSKPEDIANAIGEYLKENTEEIIDFNVIKGFLNLVISDNYWIGFLNDVKANPEFGKPSATGKTVMIEYSSPNTNKPLHLGHIRNNLLGFAAAKISAANGNKVVKANLVNDRGIHICKSMLAWQRFGNGETPESTGKKGDHFVGDYYVRFEAELVKEANSIIEKWEAGNFESIEDATEVKVWLENRNTSDDEEKIKGINKKITDLARNMSSLMVEAKEMLLKWEAEDKATVDLWKTMNGWVYDGFDETYTRMGVDFDKMYYESETYLLGKEMVEEGLEMGVLSKKEDGSVWIDLSDDGLDEKLLLRSDGTSVYMTQDMGTAKLKYDDCQYDQSVYVVGNEQDYHFKVLKLILQKMKKPYADGIFHLSYGMVDLPTGKMKSREGTVVDADDLMEDMVNEAEKQTRASGKIEGMSEEEASALFEMIGMGALKFYLLKVDPVKRMLFNPEESIDLQGFTGPFVQYTHARIKSVLRKWDALDPKPENADYKSLEPLEKELLILLSQYPSKLKEAGDSLSPAIIANYAYDLAKTYNKFYHDHSILSAEPGAIQFRIDLSMIVAKYIGELFGLLGIMVPERM